MRSVPWILALLGLAVAAALLHGSGGDATAPRIECSAREREECRPPTLATRATRRPGSVAPPEAHVSISGRVLGPDGAPARHALVQWKDGDGVLVARTRADARGVFALHGPEAGGTLCVSSRGGDRLETDVDVQDTAELRLQLREGRPLEGVVRTGKSRQPAVGARVRTWSVWFGASEAVTDERGAFRLAAVPVDDDFDVRVEAGAQGRTEIENVVWAEGERLEILLPDVRTLCGRVVCARTGRGVQDARVVNVYRVGGSEGGICWSGYARDGSGTVTDSEGRFVYEGITSHGELEVHAESWHLPAAERHDWGMQDDVVLRVVPRVTVRGTVVDERGEPVAGADVEMHGAFAEKPVLSDASGRFVIPAVALSPKGNVLEAQTAHRAGWMRVRGQAGQPVEDIELRLRRMATVTGTVLDEKGAPLARAAVHFWWKDDRHSRNQGTWTDDVGRFSLGGIEPGACTVDAEAEGYQEVERVHDVAPGRNDVGEIRLKPLRMRDARVVDEAGVPIPSAWWRSRPYASVRERPVAADGTFRFATTRKGRFFDLTVGAPDYIDATLEKKHLPVADPVEVVLRKAHYVEGRLLDLEGRPVTGARIVCRGARWVTSFWGNRTDMAGRFRVKVGAPGPYALNIYSGHFFPPDVRIEADAAPVDVRAHPACFVGGRVVGPTGVGIGNARVYVAGGWQKSRWLRADAEGRFRVEGLLGRNFRVKAYCDDDDLTFRPLQAVLPNTEDALLQAEHAYVIGGTVTWSDGRPAAEVDVRVTPVGHNADGDYEETDENGVFRFTGLPAGAYEMEAWATIEIEDEEDQEEENDLEFDAGKTVVHAGAEGLRLVLCRTAP